MCYFRLCIRIDIQLFVCSCAVRDNEPASERVSRLPWGSDDGPCVVPASPDVSWSAAPTGRAASPARVNTKSTVDGNRSMFRTPFGALPTGARRTTCQRAAAAAASRVVASGLATGPFSPLVAAPGGDDLGVPRSLVIHMTSQPELNKIINFAAAAAAVAVAANTNASQKIWAAVLRIMRMD